jgi:hypothetical protein
LPRAIYHPRVEAGGTAPSAKPHRESRAASSDPNDLRLWARNVAVTSGFVLTVAGVVGVFTAKNDNGTIALLAGGVVLLIVGLVGRAPSSLKFGPAELGMAVTRELATARVAENAGDVEGARRSLDAAIQLSALAVEPATTASVLRYSRQLLDAETYSREVLLAVGDPAGTRSVLATRGGAALSDVDGIIIDTSVRRAAILETRAGTAFAPYALRQKVITALFNIDLLTPLGGALVVVQAEPSDPTVRELDSALSTAYRQSVLRRRVHPDEPPAQRLKAIAWIHNEDPEPLRQALDWVLGVEATARSDE